MIKAVIFDFGRTLYKQEEDILYPETLSLLNYLKVKKLKLAVISRTEDSKKRYQDFKRFDLEKYFDFLEVIPKEGTKDFNRALKELKVKPEETLVVGDRIKSEIVEANKIGMKTIGLSQGKFANEIPESHMEYPNYTISSLKEAWEIFEDLLSEK